MFKNRFDDIEIKDFSFQMRDILLNGMLNNIFIIKKEKILNLQFKYCNNIFFYCR